MNLSRILLTKRTSVYTFTACNIFGLPERGNRFFSTGRTVHTNAHRPQNHYDVLGLTPRATQDQIKSAYYKLSKEFHPDMNKSEDAKKKFSEISEAYEVLGSTARRRIYDGHTHRGTGGFQSAVRGRAVDAESAQFKRPSGQFKQRPVSPIVGKTATYNFDEFYREHYGRSLRDSRDRLQQKKRAVKYYSDQGINKTDVRINIGLLCLISSFPIVSLVLYLIDYW